MSAFAGRTAVITGVTSGIGAALTQRLLDGGATVVGVARAEEKLARASERWGARFRACAADLSDRDARAAAFARLAESLPSVDVVISNAAEVVYELPSALPIDRWRSLFEVNFLAGVELVMKLRSKLPAGAQVVCVSSVTARFSPNARFSPYAITKAAVEKFVADLRLELDPHGIKVSLVVPGLVDTPIYDKVEGFEHTRAKIREQLPVWLSPEDVADATVWLLSRPPHVVVSELVLLPKGQAR